jgi:hypothetical protein
VNIFEASYAFSCIEDQAKEAGIAGNQLIIFYMWLADDRFPGHTFDDAFIGKILKDIKTLAKEFDEWAHKEAMESLKSSLLEPS